MQGMAWSECTTHRAFESTMHTRVGDGLNVLATRKALESTGQGVRLCKAGRGWSEYTRTHS